MTAPETMAGRVRLEPKLLIMPALAFRVARSPAFTGRPSVLVAQGLSWCGDVALMGQGRRPFLVGLSSFLAAHVAYASAYRARSTAGVWDTPQRRGIAAAGGAAALAMAVAAFRRDRVLLAPVAVYGTTLASTVAAAAAVDSEQGRRRILTGASLFFLSDLLIGVREFVGGKDSTALQTAVTATYAIGQWCIADGMVTRHIASRSTPDVVTNRARTAAWGGGPKR